MEPRERVDRFRPAGAHDPQPLAVLDGAHALAVDPRPDLGPGGVDLGFDAREGMPTTGLIGNVERKRLAHA